MKRIVLAALPEQPIAHHPDIQKRVVLAVGIVPHLAQLAQARLAPGQIAAGHAHADMWEIFLVESGQGVIRIDGAPHALGPGVCVLVEPGEVHEVEATGSTDLVLAYFGVVR